MHGSAGVVLWLGGWVDGTLGQELVHLAAIEPGNNMVGSALLLIC